MFSTEQKLLCGVAHLGWMVGLPILAPLVIMLITGDRFIKDQAKEALVFQIAVIVFGAIFAILSILLIGIPFLFVLAIGALILHVIAVVKICDGVDYSYPITGTFARRKL